MKLYSVTWSESEPTAQSREWFGSRRSAEKCERENDGRIEQIDVPTTRAGLLSFLNANNWRWR